MGRFCHHAIIVTSHDHYTERAHKEAIRCCGADFVTPMGARLVNAVSSFLVTPDGSKEGWPESADGERRRDQFIEWLNRQRHDDGSSPYDWVLVEYGQRAGENGAAVIDHAWTVKIGEHYKGPHDLDLKEELARGRRS